MFIVMGASGQGGSKVAEALLKRGQAVTIVTRDRDHGNDLKEKGATVAVADIEDVGSLREAFGRGGRRNAAQRLRLW